MYLILPKTNTEQQQQLFVLMIGIFMLYNNNMTSQYIANTYRAVIIILFDTLAKTHAITASNKSLMMITCNSF
jgi:hypothetical protein